MPIGHIVRGGCARVLSNERLCTCRGNLRTQLAFRSMGLAGDCSRNESVNTHCTKEREYLHRVPGRTNNDVIHTDYVKYTYLCYSVRCTSFTESESWDSVERTGVRIFLLPFRSLDNFGLSTFSQLFQLY